LGDIPTVDELLECYSMAMGGDTKTTKEVLKFYVAFVAFRNGAIIQGVYKRALTGANWISRRFLRRPSVGGHCG